MESTSGTDEVVAAEEADVALDAALLVSALDAGLAVEGVDVEVGAERDPPVSLDPLPGEPDHLGDGSLEVVVADLVCGHPAEDLEGVHVPFEEGLLPARGRRAVDGFAAVGHAQREQVAGDQLAAQPDRDLPEVDLTFPAGQVGLGDEHVGLSAAVLGPHVGSPLPHVGADGVVGDTGQVVLVNQPGEDPGSRVPLLARRVQIGHQHLLDPGLERVQLRAAVGVGRPGRGPGRAFGGLDCPPGDVTGPLDLAGR